MSDDLEYERLFTFEPASAPYSQETNCGAEQVAQYCKAAMEELGVAPGLYTGLTKVCSAHGCLMWIRGTNAGVIEGLTQSLATTGKTMFTKGKSCEYPPLKANLAFFSSLSKAWNIKLAEMRGAPGTEQTVKQWKALATEQDTLLNVVMSGATVDFTPPDTTSACVYPDQLFIPRVLPATILEKQFPKLFESGPPPEFSIFVTPTYGIRTDASPRSSNDEIEFRWVNVGTFTELNAAFRAEMNTALEPTFKTKAPPNGSAPGAAWAFVGDLVPFGPLKTDQYYRLYVNTETLEQATRAYWSATDAARADGSKVSQTIRSAALDAFAPKLSGNALFRAVSVLAQAKSPKSTSAVLEYFAIVADYDVFCVAPSVVEVRTLIGKLIKGQPQTLEPRSRTMVERLAQQPSRQPDHFMVRYRDGRGLISPYEEVIRRAVNAAILDPTGQSDYTKTAPDSTAEMMLHGCEVNNLFYTEKFSDVIFVSPITSTAQLIAGYLAKDDEEDRTRPTKAPRFTISAPGYVLTACSGRVDDALKGLNPLFFGDIEPKPDWRWPAWRDETLGDVAWHYLPQLNFAWPLKAEEDEAIRGTLEEHIVDSPSTTIEEKRRNAFVNGLVFGLLGSHSPPTPRRPDTIKTCSHQAERLFYYGGYLRSLYIQLGRCKGATLRLAKIREDVKSAMHQLWVLLVQLRTRAHSIDAPVDDTILPRAQVPAWQSTDKSVGKWVKEQLSAFNREVRTACMEDRAGPGSNKIEMVFDSSFQDMRDGLIDQLEGTLSGPAGGWPALMQSTEADGFFEPRILRFSTFMEKASAPAGMSKHQHDEAVRQIVAALSTSYPEISAEQDPRSAHRRVEAIVRAVYYWRAEIALIKPNEQSEDTLQRLDVDDGSSTAQPGPSTASGGGISALRRVGRRKQGPGSRP